MYLACTKYFDFVISTSIFTLYREYAKKNMTDVLRLQLCTKVDYQGGRYVYLQS